MKLGIISLGGKSSKDILEKSKKYFEEVVDLDIKKIKVQVDSKELKVVYENEPLEDYDCIYLRGSFKYSLLQRSIARALHTEVYMPIEPDAFTIGHNKFLTLLELQKNKVPLPKSYIAATTEVAKKLLEQVNYPIIMKIPSGTHGKGVMFADSTSSARSILDTLEVFNQPYILQEYVETNSTDLRAIVVGNRVIATMQRKASKEELRANIHAGATGKSFELSPDDRQIAIKAARAIGAEVCAVDLLEGGGKVQVIEVNLSPGLEGITKATKIDIAEEIAKFLFEKTKEFRNKEKPSESPIKEIGSEGQIKKQIMTTLDIRAGMIRLPKIITDLGQFILDDDVVIEVKGGEIIIKKHSISRV